MVAARENVRRMNMKKTDNSSLLVRVRHMADPQFLHYSAERCVCRLLFLKNVNVRSGA